MRDLLQNKAFVAIFATLAVGLASSSCKLIGGSFDKGEGGAPSSASLAASVSSSSSGGATSVTASTAVSSSTGCDPTTTSVTSSTSSGGDPCKFDGVPQGCPPCEHCVPDQKHLPVCAMAGGVALGDVCKVDADCAGAAICVARDKNGKSGVCRAICTASNQCATGTCSDPSYAYQQSGAPDFAHTFRTCTADCDPLGDGADCPANLGKSRCDLLLGLLTSEFFVECDAATPPLNNTGSCNSQFDCDPRQICGSTDNGNTYRCLGLCDRNKGDTDCKMPATCHLFSDLVGANFSMPVFSGKLVGVCF